MLDRRLDLEKDILDELIEQGATTDAILDQREMIMDIERRATPKYIEVFHELLERFESRYWQGQNQSSLQQENK